MAEATGLSPLVPADRVRAHLVSLLAAGGSSRSIAVAAGVSRRTVSDVAAGRRRRIRQDVAGRLEAVTAGTPALVKPGRLVAAGPTLERLDRLAQLGCSRAWIAGRLGMARPPEGPRFVAAEVAVAVDELLAEVEGSLDLDRA